MQFNRNWTIPLLQASAIGLLRVLSRCPLRLLHWVGGLLGWIPFIASTRYRRRIIANLAQAGLAGWGPVRNAVRGIGAGALELAFIWMRPVDEVLAKVVSVEGREYLTDAAAVGRGVVYLTPHLGCFELAALYIGAHRRLSAMYRPPRIGWLEPIMLAGRERGQVRLCPADASGLRSLMRALRAGEAIGILPDQVPQAGGGEWADFFGRPAYTSTLASRFAATSQAQLILCVCERLPAGKGYRMSFSPLAVSEHTSAARQINSALEQAIRRLPEQYLWSYNRYKTPRGANAHASAPGLNSPAGKP